eukprot:UN04995
MFSFANDIWNKIIKYICCCFCFGLNEDGWLQRGATFSRSIRQKLSFKNRNKLATIQATKKSELPTIKEKVKEQENNDIEIIFDNNITSDDLNKNKNENGNGHGDQAVHMHGKKHNVNLSSASIVVESSSDEEINNCNLELDNFHSSTHL